MESVLLWTSKFFVDYFSYCHFGGLGKEKRIELGSSIQEDCFNLNCVRLGNVNNACVLINRQNYGLCFFQGFIEDFRVVNHPNFYCSFVFKVTIECLDLSNPPEIKDHADALMFQDWMAEHYPGV